MQITDIKLPEEIWLAGKGPTLDSFDWNLASEWRFAINHAAYIVPNCMGVFAIDYEVYDILIAKPIPDIIVIKKFSHTHYSFPKEFSWTREMGPPMGTVTSPIAIYVLSYLGAKKINLVGFDAIKGNLDRAECIKPLMPKLPNTTKNYINVCNQIRIAQITTGVELVLW